MRSGLISDGYWYELVDGEYKKLPTSEQEILNEKYKNAMRMVCSPVDLDRVISQDKTLKGDE